MQNKCYHDNCCVLLEIQHFSIKLFHSKKLVTEIIVLSLVLQASGRMQLAIFNSVYYILLISLSFGSYAADKIPLYFSFITSRTGGFISSGAIPIIDKALEQINNHSDILQNYNLQYTTILDSNVSTVE